MGVTLSFVEGWSAEARPPCFDGLNMTALKKNNTLTLKITL